MQAGRLDRRITVQRATSTQARTGQPVLTFEDWLERSAQVKHLSGRELLAAQQLVADVDTQFSLRYDAQVKTITPTETYRIEYDARLYDVRYSQEDTDQPRRRAWKILARARAEAAA
jgi:SPP1 family predicted phage head-tail adaptor